MMPVAIKVWREGGAFFWDTAEDTGGIDRVSPQGPFADRPAAQYDAIGCFPWVTFSDGRPDHYPETGLARG